MFTRIDRYPYSRKRTKCCNRGSTNVDSFFEVQRSLRNLEVDEAGVKRPLEHQTDLREPENIIVVVGVGSLLDDLEPARDIYIGEDEDGAGDGGRAAGFAAAGAAAP